MDTELGDLRIRVRKMLENDVGFAAIEMWDEDKNPFAAMIFVGPVGKAQFDALRDTLRAAMRYFKAMELDL